MKVKTVIEDRFPKKIADKQNRLILAVTLLINTFFSTLLPFVIGFYFAFTQSMFFLFAFIILLFIELRVDYEKDKIKIQIIRGWK